MSCFDMVGRPWVAFFLLFPLPDCCTVVHVGYFYLRQLLPPVFCANNSLTKSFVSRVKTALIPVNVNLLIFKVNEMLFAA